MEAILISFYSSLDKPDFKMKCNNYSAHRPNWRCNGRPVGRFLCLANGYWLGAADLGC